MKRIYIDKPGIALKVEKQRLLIKDPDKLKGTSVPCTHIEAIVMSRKTDLSSSLLLQLSAHNIDVLFINSRNHDIAVYCGHYHHGNYQRTYAQVCLLEQPGMCMDFARSIVQAKAQQQQRTLKRIMRKRQDCHFELNRTFNLIKELTQQLPNTKSVASLRGSEGLMAKYYFAGIRPVFSSSLEFSGRRKRPPPDPVNSLLSLGYTLIHSDCVRALLATGLDPRFGVLHDNAYNRQSLACDLMEIFRPRYDAVVWRWFAEQTFRKRDFAFNNGACFLTKDARGRFYKSFESHSRIWRKMQRRIAQRWVKQLDQNYTELQYAQ